MSRISLKTDQEQRQYENMSEVLERKSSGSSSSHASSAVNPKGGAPPDVFINFDTWLNVWTSGRA
jgi:hypothetical protein